MEATGKRFLYIDNLRLLVIMLVIIMHLSGTYSGFGSWYVTEGKPVGLISTVIFGFYQSFTQGYFMGLLFLLSGFFIPGAYDRKGFSKFIRDRFIRLGIPTLIYMLAITPFILYVQLDLNWARPKPSFTSYYIDYLGSLQFIRNSGPMWFAFALLIFSVIYGLVRVSGKGQNTSKEELKPEFKHEIILILIISLCAFLIRLIQPIGTSILGMQLCHFSQYVILFIVGMLAYRNNLFSKLDPKSGKIWLFSGLIPGTVVWLAIMILGGAIHGDQSFNGGLSWQATAYALWESFVAVSMSIGLLTLFKEKFNHQTKLVKILADNSFAVYVFHPPIIIAAAQLIKPLAWLPILKFSLLCLICPPICFAFTYFIVRRIPLLKKVM
ncbi:hypothetical protein DP73_14320 [Desulfosporosinus sp. HMP52]|uniref:acyltransferase family protein n=1 Tax=Desulfosporosinus sp. HMP52 TaxID=1487923 RepID=UPI00051FDCE3|nr:acyltransferase family protein [Desulfosporosinus sp. HMP52]KGK87428.1 hypothetical protein DP73_14320 [Desulfosporosinus sp. HMP52]